MAADSKSVPPLVEPFRQRVFCFPWVFLAWERNKRWEGICQSMFSEQCLVPNPSQTFARCLRHSAEWLCVPITTISQGSGPWFCSCERCRNRSPCTPDRAGSVPGPTAVVQANRAKLFEIRSRLSTPCTMLHNTPAPLSSGKRSNTEKAPGVLAGGRPTSTVRPRDRQVEAKRHPSD